MKNLARIKLIIGSKLMSWGANLCLNSEAEKERFKTKINNNTTTGSICGSGDALRHHVKPMCDYDTDSVINVLKQELLVSGDIWKDDHKTSKKVEYYKEEWV